MKRFQNHIAESHKALPLVSIYGVALFFMAEMEVYQRWTSLALIAATTYLLAEYNNTYALIRTYSRMVSCSFLILTLMATDAMFQWPVAALQLSTAAMLFCLLQCYQDNRSVGWTFHTFLFLGIASIIFPHALYFAPVILIIKGFKMMSLSFKTFMASLLGLITPYWFWVPYKAYFESTDCVIKHFMKLSEFADPSIYYSLTINQVVTAFVVILLTLIGIFHFYSTKYLDKIRTQIFFESFSIISIITIIFLVLQPQHYMSIMAMLIVIACPLIGHFAALTQTKTSNITFISALVIIILTTALNLWMPSLPF